MTFIRQSEIARTLITAVAKAIEPIAVALDRAACRLAFLGRPLEDE